MLQGQTIIYTGNFSIEKMNAAGKRVYANALILKQLGYHVVMVGVDASDDKTEDILGTKSELEGIEFYHYPGELFKKSRVNYRAFSKQFEKLLLQNKWNVKAIIGYGSPSISLFIGSIQSYCRRNGIKYIADVVDWLSDYSKNPIFDRLKQIDTTMKNAYYSNKSDGIIAISTFLAEYYKKKVKNVIVVPALAPERKITDIADRGIPQIVYAGIPFRKGAVLNDLSAMKDRFDLACELLVYAEENGVPFQFHVYGFTKEEILVSVPSLKGTLDMLGDKIIFHGMASMDKVQTAVSEADYTILVREKKRMTMAGFPTKVSESISCGTPVITTKTSDIERYLPEGQGAFFVDISDMSAAKEKVLELLRKSPEERALQKKICEDNKSFEIRTYIDPMRGFISSVLS